VVDPVSASSQTALSSDCPFCLAWSARFDLRDALRAGGCPLLKDVWLTCRGGISSDEEEYDSEIYTEMGEAIARKWRAVDVGSVSMSRQGSSR
jgi:hypothetical protein